MATDPELNAAVAARDIDAVVDHLARRWSIPADHDEWVLDLLCDGIPADADEEPRARIRAGLRDRLPEITERTRNA